MLMHGFFFKRIVLMEIMDLRLEHARKHWWPPKLVNWNLKIWI